MISKKQHFIRLISVILDSISSSREQATNYLLDEGYTIERINEIETRILDKIRKKELELKIEAKQHIKGFMGGKIRK